ncbi:hypothetical protein P7K49_013988 [Saguinus oedipus]|uniref:Uncharacterized protein n=1 Tax=Saguinus oedipus TaxID=9490 RepID=A0ABQ9VHJ8_SAGOE|nr:hypothetical protein P7K49_013988 [Saguinus oedipus]
MGDKESLAQVRENGTYLKKNRQSSQAVGMRKRLQELQQHLPETAGHGNGNTRNKLSLEKLPCDDMGPEQSAEAQAQELKRAGSDDQSYAAGQRNWTEPH